MLPLGTGLYCHWGPGGPDLVLPLGTFGGGDMGGERGGRGAGGAVGGAEGGSDGGGEAPTIASVASSLHSPAHWSCPGHVSVTSRPCPSHVPGRRLHGAQPAQPCARSSLSVLRGQHAQFCARFMACWFVVLSGSRMRREPTTGSQAFRPCRVMGAATSTGATTGSQAFMVYCRVIAAVAATPRSNVSVLYFSCSCCTNFCYP